MVEQVIARQVEAVQGALRPFLEVVTQSPARGAQPVTADFLAGNPQESTLPGFVEALRRWSVPTSTDWFAYRMMHEPARQAAAASLTAELGVGFAARDGAIPVRVRLEPPAFDLDVDAIVAALGPRTRAIIVNTPHNPTGRIYPAAALQRLAAGLAEAAGRYGRPIWVISDEAYSRILFDGRRFPSPGSSTRIRCSPTPTARARWHRGNGSVSWLWRPGCRRPRSCAGHCCASASE